MPQPTKPRYQPGDRIGGRYEVYKALMGGMGEVYLCLDLEEMLPLALKTFQQRYQSSALRRAFEEEVATWVGLEKHPNIVRCFHMDILDNQPFMVLEWIAGEEGKGADLRGWLRRGPLDLKMALEITLDVVRGLLHAQEKQPGLVHRDLKPENILVAQGGLAKITDFGLAQIVESAGLEFVPEENSEEARLSRENRSATISIVNPKSKIQNRIAGTPAYMAPEQWRGEALDERTDIYAVGCMLYEMLVGEWPFQVEFRPTTPQQFQKWLSVLQQGHESVPPPSLPVELPGEVGDIVGDCLAKAPDDRPANLTLLVEWLGTLYERQFGRPPPPRPQAAAFSDADYNNRGVTYQNIKQYEAALADYARAIELNPADATAYNNRGNTYQELQQYEAALADYARAIELNPADATAYNNRGLTYKEMQQTEAALADYARAIELNPADATAYNNRGLTYKAMQQTEAALADYARAIELNPADAKAFYNRGNTYKAMQQYEAALADYARAIELNPADATAYNNRGNTYKAMQQYEAALADYARAIELNPAYATAYLNLGALLGNQGMLREALPYFEKAAQLGDPTGTQYAAQVRQMLGESAPVPQPDPAQAAFEAFQQAASAEEMRQSVARYPFMAQPDFVAAIEQIIAQQAPPAQRPYFEERLGWLRQVGSTAD